MHTWHHSKRAPELIPIDLGFQNLNPLLVCSGRSNDTHLVDATGAEVPIEYVELRCQWLRWKSAGLASRSTTFVLDVHPTGRNHNQFWGFMIWIVWNWMLRNWIGELWWIGGWTVNRFWNRRCPVLVCGVPSGRCTRWDEHPLWKT